MKKTIVLLMLAGVLASCKKEETEEPGNNGPSVCNCGIIQSETWNQATGAFTVSIKSECSGYTAQFVSNLSTYQQYGVGDRICWNNVPAW